MKGFYPVETEGYAVAQGIDKYSAYNWWVEHVLRNRDRVILAMKQRNDKYIKRKHKFGIEGPKTFAEAIDLDENNGDTL